MSNGQVKRWWMCLGLLMGCGGAPHTAAPGPSSTQSEDVVEQVWSVSASTEPTCPAVASCSQVVDATAALLPALGAALDPVMLDLAGGITHAYAACIALTATGVASVALRFAAPERAAILALCDRAGGAGRDGDRALVMIEAALGLMIPDWIEVVAAGAGPAAVLGYDEVGDRLPEDAAS